MNIILIGPPGAGKGTQADYICSHFKIPKISTGDILRAEVAAGSDIGKKCKAIIDAGKLVADDLIVEMVLKRVQEADCRTGFLLDGFPRTIQQADLALKSGINIDYVLQLVVPDEEIITRLSGRRIHPGSGRTYHITYNPPKEENKDDVTGEDLIQRADDKVETITERLATYHNHTAPLIDWFKQHTSTLGTELLIIDGVGQLDDVKQRVLASIVSTKIGAGE